VRGRETEGRRKREKLLNQLEEVKLIVGSIVTAVDFDEEDLKLEQIDQI
jgi:hypothetical protein